MNFSLGNPSVPEFPNSDFFIPIFHYEEKRNPPRAREAYAGDFFGSVPTAGASRGTRKHGIRRNTPILYVAFQSSFTSILIAAMTSSNDCFFSE